MVVDEDGFDELAALHAEMYEKTLDIQARSDERRTGTDDEGIPTMSTNMFFETPDPPEARRQSSPSGT